MGGKVLKLFKSIVSGSNISKVEQKRHKVSSSASYALSHLIRCNLPAEEVKMFAFATSAQSISTIDFRVLLERGPKYIINFFLRQQKQKSDYLDFEKVAAILHVSGLQFLNSSNELEQLGTFERAKYLLSCAAELEPKALLALIMNKELALTAIAKRTDIILFNRYLAEHIAVMADLSALDVISYCENPYLVRNSHSSFTKIDFLYLDALKKAA